MQTTHPSPRGAAPAPSVVVALHCSGSSGRQWDAYAAPRPGGPAWLTPDLLGYGPHPWRRGDRMTLDDEARHVVALLPPRETVALVGHSYGGAVALQVALRWPQRIASLTLYEPVRFALLLADRASSGLARSILEVGHRIAQLARAGDLPSSARIFVDYWSGDGTWDRLPPGRQDVLAARMHKVSAEFEALFTDPIPPSAYRSLAMPVRLLRGSRSPAAALRVSDLLAGHVRHADVVTLPGLGHMGPVTHAARVAADIQSGTRCTTEPVAASA